MICCDITDPICQVRIKIADAKAPTQFSDVVINQFLLKYSGDVLKASVELLAYCVSVAAGRARERVDDVEVDWPAIYHQKKELLQLLQADTAFGGNTALHMFGGTSKKEMQRVCDNSDSNLLSVTVGEFSKLEEDVINYYANYRN